MAKFGRLSAQITVPAGGWSVALTVTAIGGPVVVTIAAGTYWIDELITAFLTQLNAAFGGDGLFTYQSGFDEGGDGLFGLFHATQTFSITWTSTALRDLLGYTADLTPAAASFTGTEVVEAIWRSSHPYDSPHGQSLGVPHRDRTVSVAADGTMVGHGFTSRLEAPRITWPHVSAARTLTQYETVANESFQTWFTKTHLGGVTYFGAAPKVRFYWDASAVTYVQLKLTDPVDSFDPQRVDANWIGLFPISIAGWVQS